MVTTVVSRGELLEAAAQAALNGKFVGFISRYERQNGDAFDRIIERINPRNCRRITKSTNRRTIETVTGGRIHFVPLSGSGHRGMSVELLCLQGSNHYTDEEMGSVMPCTSAQNAPILETEDVW